MLNPSKRVKWVLGSGLVGGHLAFPSSGIGSKKIYHRQHFTSKTDDSGTIIIICILIIVWNTERANNKKAVIAHTLLIRSSLPNCHVFAVFCVVSSVQTQR